MPNKMNSEIKKKWVEALRSGKYTQGRGYLNRNNEAYCCLGVLCDLHSKETETPWCGEGIPGYDGAYYFVPRSVQEWAELSGEDPTINIIDTNGDNASKTLSQLNDYHIPFTTIADYIEEQL